MTGGGPRLLVLNPFPWLPDTSGGAQQSTRYLLDALTRRGWQVELVCGQRLRAPNYVRNAWRSLLRGRLPLPVWRDDQYGWPVWRCVSFLHDDDRWRAVVDERLDALRPDVVLGHADPDQPLLAHAAARGFSSWLFVRAVDLYPPGTAVPDDLGPLANAPFTADHLARATGRPRPPVVLPFVDVSAYRAERREPRFVTMVNPIPRKGRDVVLELVHRLPEVDFLLVEGTWVEHLDHDDPGLAAAAELPNVTVWPNQADMREVYAVTDVLLVPSQYDETFGRVVIEAQANAIPVIVSDRGGLAFTLGDGGVLVDPADDVTAWATAIEQVHGDRARHDELSRLSLANTEREELDPERQVDAFVAAVGLADR